MNIWSEITKPSRIKVVLDEMSDLIRQAYELGQTLPENPISWDGYERLADKIDLLWESPREYQYDFWWKEEWLQQRLSDK